MNCESFEMRPQKLLLQPVSLTIFWDSEQRRFLNRMNKVFDSLENICALLPSHSDHEQAQPSKRLWKSSSHNTPNPNPVCQEPKQSETKANAHLAQIYKELCGRSSRADGEGVVFYCQISCNVHTFRILSLFCLTYKSLAQRRRVFKDLIIW